MGCSGCNTVLTAAQATVLVYGLIQKGFYTWEGLQWRFPGALHAQNETSVQKCSEAGENHLPAVCWAAVLPVWYVETAQCVPENLNAPVRSTQYCRVLKVFRFSCKLLWHCAVIVAEVPLKTSVWQLKSYVPGLPRQL